MTTQERRGKWLFLILAGLIILGQFVGIGFTLARGLNKINWLNSVARPIGVALFFAFLWQGEIWYRWLVGLYCVLVGGMMVFIGVFMFIKFTEALAPNANEFVALIRYIERASGIFGLYGLFYILAGLMFLFSPSMRAFFRYQREGTAVT